MTTFIENLKRLFVERNHLKCPLCNNVFSTSAGFDNHIKTVHK